MPSDNETVEDIVLEMRNAPSYFVDDENGGCRMFMREDVVAFARRIAAAHNREVSALNEVIDANLRVHKAVERSDADAKLALNGEIVRRNTLIAELCECLNEAAGTVLSCHGCLTPCGVFSQEESCPLKLRWRNVLEGCRGFAEDIHES